MADDSGAAREITPVEPVDVPAPEAEEVKHPRTGWYDRYTELPVQALRDYTPVQVLVMVIIRRHLHSRRTGKIATDVRVEAPLLEQRTGLSARTLKKWLSPGGCLSAQMTLKTNAAGSPVKVDGKWVIDVKAVWGDEGKTQVIKGGFVRVYHNWVWVNQWERREDVNAGALWAACVVASQGRNEAGKTVSVEALSNMYTPRNKANNHAGRQLMYTRLNDAEDAGLISVRNRESVGRKPATREAHTTTLLKAERTYMERHANQGFTPRKTLW